MFHDVNPKRDADIVFLDCRAFWGCHVNTTEWRVLLNVMKRCSSAKPPVAYDPEVAFKA